MVWELGFGHCASTLTVPLGVPATLDADAATLTLEVPALTREELSEPRSPRGVRGSDNSDAGASACGSGDAPGNAINGAGTAKVRELAGVVGAGDVVDRPHAGDVVAVTFEDLEVDRALEGLGTDVEALLIERVLPDGWLSLPNLKKISSLGGFPSCRLSTLFELTLS